MQNFLWRLFLILTALCVITLIMYTIILQWGNIPRETLNTTMLWIALIGSLFGASNLMVLGMERSNHYV